MSLSAKFEEQNIWFSMVTWVPQNLTVSKSLEVPWVSVCSMAKTGELFHSVSKPAAMFHQIELINHSQRCY